MNSVKCLLPFLLVGGIILNADGAIKCYQCSECPEAAKLPDLKKCEGITLVDATMEITAKTQGVDKNNPAITLLKKGIEANLGSFEPKTCFKLVTKKDGQELAYRGCAPKGAVDNTCQTDDRSKITSCVCDDDGCNAASSVFASLAFIICLSFVIFIF